MQNTRAKIRMKKTILEGAEYDAVVYPCKVLKYDRDNDRIYLVLEEGGIENISLDGIYKCTLYAEKEGMECEGKVLERYCNQEGNILCFQVEKGFYKININYVDKEEA